MNIYKFITRSIIPTIIEIGMDRAYICTSVDRSLGNKYYDFIKVSIFWFYVYIEWVKNDWRE